MTAQEPGDKHNDEKFGRFRCLQGHEAQSEPAAAAVNFATDTRYQHEQQHEVRNGQQGYTSFVPMTHRTGDHRGCAGEPHENKYQLSFEMKKRVAILLAGDFDGGGSHHDQAERH